MVGYIGIWSYWRIKGKYNGLEVSIKLYHRSQGVQAVQQQQFLGRVSSQLDTRYGGFQTVKVSLRLMKSRLQKRGRSLFLGIFPFYLLAVSLFEHQFTFLRKKSRIQVKRGLYLFSAQGCFGVLLDVGQLFVQSRNEKIIEFILLS